MWSVDSSGPEKRPPMKLWLPGPSMPDPSMLEPPAGPVGRPRPEPAPVQREKVAISPRRSHSRKRKRSRSPRNKRGGWDDQAPSHAAAALLAPSRPALPPGVTEVMPGGAQRWTGHVQVNRFGIPEATSEALAAAVLRAQQVEAAGLEAIRQTGQIPRGPPDLPTGTEVIE